MKRYLLDCSALLLMSSFMAGCTGDSQTPNADETATSSTPFSGHADGFGTRHVTLTCADAAGVSTVVGSKPGLAVGDVVIGGFATADSTVPRAEDVRLRLPDGMHWYFKKAPVILKADATVVSVSVAGPGQALAWLPLEVWTAGIPPDLGQWAARTVTLQNCPGQKTSFLGGLLAANPNACMVLQVRSREDAEHTTHRQLNGKSCAG